MFFWKSTSWSVITLNSLRLFCKPGQLFVIYLLPLDWLVCHKSRRSWPLCCRIFSMTLFSTSPTAIGLSLHFPPDFRFVLLLTGDAFCLEISLPSDTTFSLWGGTVEFSPYFCCCSSSCWLHRSYLSRSTILPLHFDKVIVLLSFWSGPRPFPRTSTTLLFWRTCMWYVCRVTLL